MSTVSKPKMERNMGTESKPKMSAFQTAPTQVTTDALVQDLFNKQRAYFATDVTKLTNGESIS